MKLVLGVTMVTSHIYEGKVHKGLLGSYQHWNVPHVARNVQL